MPRSTLSLILLLVLAALYLWDLGGVGLLGPDEPRYASIGREMAESGNWITPVLDGQPWFEKPPLLFWMSGIGCLIGLSAEWAARLPIVLVSLTFLIFFHNVLAREFSTRLALVATSILGTSAGWVAFSFASVTDLPMAAAFNAALLIAIFGPVALHVREPGSGKPGYVAGVMLGLAVLAKALVPAVLFIPVWLMARGKRLQILVAGLLVAAPWFLIAWGIHGQVFIDELFWKHHIGRFFQPDLQHVQPFWFYAPVLLGALFPWTPMALLLARPRTLDDPRIRFLLMVAGFGFVFFSAAGNKLPSYILPLLPSLAIAIAYGFDKATIPGMSLGIGNKNEFRGGAAGWWLGACAVLLAAVPVIAGILPEALRVGLTHTSPSFALGWPFLLLAGLVWGMAWGGQRELAVLTLALSAAAAVGYLKYAAFGELDQTVSARGFYREHRTVLGEACLDPYVSRDWEYGLNFYLHAPIPRCTENSRGPRVVEDPASGTLRLRARE